MISIIICSQYSNIESSLAENIKKTIGVDYEIVHIDNSHRSYSIFEAYNLGVERAKGDYLCFMHEDVLFHSKDWGKIVENYLAQPFVGALGVAGGNVVLDRLDWRFYGFGLVHLLQGTTTVEEKPNYYISYDASKIHLPLCQVAVLDGVWICIRKELFTQIRFDDKTFHDFHLYDSDICMQVNTIGLGVFMTHDILLEHKSEGTFSQGYADSLKVFSQKWKTCLPLVKGTIVTKEETEAAIDKAIPLFQERLERDKILIGLRKLFMDKKKGLPVRAYTEEEIELMDESAFRHRKLCMKDKDMSFQEVWTLVSDYMANPIFRQKAKLFMKFLWYRVLNQGKLK